MVVIGGLGWPLDTSIQGEQMKLSALIFVVLVSVLGLMGCGQKPDAEYVGTENAGAVDKLRGLFQGDFRNACENESDMPYWVGSTRMKCALVAGKKTCREVVLQEEEASDQEVAIDDILLTRAVLRGRVYLSYDQKAHIPSELHGLLFDGWICGSGRNRSIHFGDPRPN